MSLRGWGSMLGVATSGLLGLIAAAYLASALVAPVFSQTAGTKLPPKSTPPPYQYQQTQSAVKAVPTPTPPQRPGATELDPMATQAEILPDATPIDPGAEEARAKILEGIIEDYKFSPNNKRDPFLPYVSPRVTVDSTVSIFPLQRFDLDQLKLTGVIWNVRSPKAMFMDPTGKSYIVATNDRVGRRDGFIAEIREGEVIVVEKFVSQGRSTYQTRVVKITKE